MKFIFSLFPCMLLLSCNGMQDKCQTIPFRLDHNRMMIEAEVCLDDSAWHKALLWVDTGNPDFLFSQPFLERIDFEPPRNGRQAFYSPVKIRLGKMVLHGDSIRSVIDRLPSYLYNAMHYDGNLPSSVLKNYHVIFDYPGGTMTIAEPGILRPEGVPAGASVNRNNGIIQMDATIDGKKYSFALDNGASFSYIPDFLVEDMHEEHPDWPVITGATGCANIWGWWPLEESWTVMKIPGVRWGQMDFNDVLVAGLPPIFRGNSDVGTNYSRKTARPVNGFFGPNVFRQYRVEIIYPDSVIYFRKGEPAVRDEMVLVGLTLKPLDDGRYAILGVVSKEGKTVAGGIRQGDILLQVDDLKVTGLTMGKVVDALRGRPGEKHKLIVERDGTLLNIEAAAIKLL